MNFLTRCAIKKNWDCFPIFQETRPWPRSSRFRAFDPQDGRGGVAWLHVNFLLRNRLKKAQAHAL